MTQEQPPIDPTDIDINLDEEQDTGPETSADLAEVIKNEKDTRAKKRERNSKKDDGYGDDDPWAALDNLDKDKLNEATEEHDKKQIKEKKAPKPKSPKTDKSIPSGGVNTKTTTPKQGGDFSDMSNTEKLETSVDLEALLEDGKGFLYTKDLLDKLDDSTLKNLLAKIDERVNSGKWDMVRDENFGIRLYPKGNLPDNPFNVNDKVEKYQSKGSESPYKPFNEMTSEEIRNIPASEIKVYIDRLEKAELGVFVFPSELEDAIKKQGKGNSDLNANRLKSVLRGKFSAGWQGYRFPNKDHVIYSDIDLLPNYLKAMVEESSKSSRNIPQPPSKKGSPSSKKPPENNPNQPIPLKEVVADMRNVSSHTDTNGNFVITDNDTGEVIKTINRASGSVDLQISGATKENKPTTQNPEDIKRKLGKSLKKNMYGMRERYKSAQEIATKSIHDQYQDSNIAEENTVNNASGQAKAQENNQNVVASGTKVEQPDFVYEGDKGPEEPVFSYEGDRGPEYGDMGPLAERIDDKNKTSGKVDTNADNAKDQDIYDYYKSKRPETIKQFDTDLQRELKDLLAKYPKTREGDNTKAEGAYNFIKGAGFMSPVLGIFFKPYREEAEALKRAKSGNKRFFESNKNYAQRRELDIRNQQSRYNRSIEEYKRTAGEMLEKLATEQNMPDRLYILRKSEIDRVANEMKQKFDESIEPDIKAVETLKKYSKWYNPGMVFTEIMDFLPFTRKAGAKLREIKAAKHQLGNRDVFEDRLNFAHRVYNKDKVYRDFDKFVSSSVEENLLDMFAYGNNNPVSPEDNVEENKDEENAPEPKPKKELGIVSKDRLEKRLEIMSNAVINNALIEIAQSSDLDDRKTEKVRAIIGRTINSLNLSEVSQYINNKGTVYINKFFNDFPDVHNAIKEIAKKGEKKKLIIKDLSNKGKTKKPLIIKGKSSTPNDKKKLLREILQNDADETNTVESSLDKERNTLANLSNDLIKETIVYDNPSYNTAGMYDQMYSMLQQFFEYADEEDIADYAGVGGASKLIQKYPSFRNAIGGIAKGVVMDYANNQEYKKPEPLFRSNFTEADIMKIDTGHTEDGKFIKPESSIGLSPEYSETAYTATLDLFNLTKDRIKDETKREYLFQKLTSLVSTMLKGADDKFADRYKNNWSAGRKMLEDMPALVKKIDSIVNEVNSRTEDIKLAQKESTDDRKIEPAESKPLEDIEPDESVPIPDELDTINTGVLKPEPEKAPKWPSEEEIMSLSTMAYKYYDYTYEQKNKIIDLRGSIVDAVLPMDSDYRVRDQFSRQIKSLLEMVFDKNRDSLSSYNGNDLSSLYNDIPGIKNKIDKLLEDAKNRQNKGFGVDESEYTNGELNKLFSKFNEEYLMGIDVIAKIEKSNTALDRKCSKFASVLLSMTNSVVSIKNAENALPRLSNLLYKIFENQKDEDVDYYIDNDLSDDRQLLRDIPFLIKKVNAIVDDVNGMNNKSTDSLPQT